VNLNIIQRDDYLEQKMILLLFLLKLVSIKGKYINNQISIINPVLNFLACCLFGECCDGNYVPKNFTKLDNDLNELLFGQPLVKKDLVNSLKGHLDSNLALPPKALVLSLHGNTGIL
jgi:hypothetical protein